MIGNSLAGIFPEVQQLYPEASPSPPPAGALLDSITRGVVFVDCDGILTFMNSYAAEVLRVDSEKVVGKRVDMLPLRTPLYKVLSEQCRDVPLEMAVDGRVVSAQSREVRSDDGVVRGEMTELWDITEVRRAKRQWEEFVAMMTHDLRSPLTVIMGYVQGMLCGMYGELGGRVRDVVEEVEQSGFKLNAMIEEMLDTYRLEVGLLTLKRQRCNLGKILEGCYHDNLRAAQGRGINLVLAQNEPLPDMEVDGRLLTRAFNNLIGNAIKYTPAAGRVTVSTETAADLVRITVVDTGIGIPAEDLPRVFIKYYRSAGAAGFKGTGLGLAISKNIIEAHNGSIEVESTVGKGSRFRTVLPVGGSDHSDTPPADGRA